MGTAAEVTKVGRRGSVVIPAKVRKQLGIAEGDLLIFEVVERGVIIRPAVALPVADCPAERRAEFILNAAIDAADYARARKTVKAMGLDPERVPHDPPPARKSVS
jgi:AbrB family looped-hinge helix DNA binding protein